MENFTHKDCEKSKEDCQKNNILPMMKQLQRVEKKLDAVMPTIKEINNVRNAWKIAGLFGGLVVKFVIGMSIILGAIYAIKEWVKK